MKISKNYLQKLITEEIDRLIKEDKMSVGERRILESFKTKVNSDALKQAAHEAIKGVLPQARPPRGVVFDVTEYNNYKMLTIKIPIG